MGKQLVIKGADFSANGLGVICNLAKGSINSVTKLIVDTSNIKFRLADTIDVKNGEKVIISGFGAPVDGLVPGWSRNFYNSSLEPIEGSYIGVAPSSSNVPLGDIEITNSTGSDAKLMVAFGYSTASKPSDFDVDAYRESYEGKIMGKIESAV